MTKVPTIDDLRTKLDELEAKFGHEPIAYPNVSMTQLSVARHYGRAMVNGKEFIYNPVDDSLILADVIAYFNKITKNTAKKKKQEPHLLSMETE